MSCSVYGNFGKISYFSVRDVHAPDQRYKSGRFSNLQPVASADGVRMGGGGNLTASWHNRSLPANPVSDGLAGFFGYIL